GVDQAGTGRAEPPLRPPLPHPAGARRRGPPLAGLAVTAGAHPPWGHPRGAGPPGPPAARGAPPPGRPRPAVRRPAPARPELSPAPEPGSFTFSAHPVGAGLRQPHSLLWRTQP